MEEISKENKTNNQNTIDALVTMLKSKEISEKDINHIIDLIRNIRPNTFTKIAKSIEINLTISKSETGLIKVYINQDLYPQLNRKSSVYLMNNISKSSSPKKLLKETRNAEIPTDPMLGPELEKFFQNANMEGWGNFPIWISSSKKGQVIIKENEIRNFLTDIASKKPEETIITISRFISQLQKIVISISTKGFIMNDIKMDNFVATGTSPFCLKAIDCGSVSKEGTIGVECTHLPPFFTCMQREKEFGMQSSLVISDLKLFYYGYIGTILEVLHLLQHQIKKHTENNTILNEIYINLPWNRQKKEARSKQINNQNIIENIILSTARVVKDIGCLFLDSNLDISRLSANKWEFFTFVNKQITDHLSSLEYNTEIGQLKTEEIKPIMGQAAKENIEYTMKFFPRRNAYGQLEEPKEAIARILNQYKDYLFELNPAKQKKAFIYEQKKEDIEPQVTQNKTENTYSSPL